MPIHLEGEKYRDVAPDRKAVVQHIALTLGECPYVCFPTEEDRLKRKDEPCGEVIAAFPRHRGKDGTPWWHAMDTRYLRYDNGRLFFTPVAKDEWFEDQYLTAAERGETW